MTAASLSTKSLVPQLLVEDVIGQIDEDLQFRPRAFARVRRALSAAVNEVAVACRDAGPVDQVIAVQRARVIAAGPTCEKAYRLFIDNMLAAA